MLNSAGTRHGDGEDRPAGQRSHFKQKLGVGGRVLGLGDTGEIADRLAEIGEMFLYPPGCRAEPEDGGMQMREKLQVEIALADVRKFVRQNNAQPGSAPVQERRGKDDAEADGDRGPDVGAEANVGVRLNQNRGWFGAAPDTPREGQAEEETQQQKS